MLVLVLKGEVEGEKRLEDMGRAGMKDRGSRITFVSKRPPAHSHATCRVHNPSCFLLFW